MLFHTWIFFAFLAIVYPVYLLVRHTRFRTPWLFISSYVFYGWWNPWYLLLIAYATAVDFHIVGRMGTHQKKAGGGGKRCEQPEDAGPVQVRRIA